jgi:hypothetical protein
VTMTEQLGFDLSDAVISKLVVGAGRVELHVKDWREVEHLVLLEDVLLLEDHGVVGEDISHMSSSASDAPVQAACERAEEEPAGYRCFSFFGAWPERPVLIVVAATVSSSDVEAV